MYEKIWSNVFMMLLFLTCAGLVILFFAWAISDKKILRYTLDSEPNTGIMYIKKEIDWDVDEKIYLDRYTTDREALVILDSLNKTIENEEKSNRSR